jgi:hypothetical protein
MRVAVATRPQLRQLRPLSVSAPACGGSYMLLKEGCVRVALVRVRPGGYVGYVCVFAGLCSFWHGGSLAGAGVCVMPGVRGSQHTLAHALSLYVWRHN